MFRLMHKALAGQGVVRKHALGSLGKLTHENRVPATASIIYFSFTSSHEHSFRFRVFSFEISVLKLSLLMATIRWFLVTQGRDLP